MHGELFAAHQAIHAAPLSLDDDALDTDSCDSELGVLSEEADADEALLTSPGVLDDELERLISTVELDELERLISTVELDDVLTLDAVLDELNDDTLLEELLDELALPTPTVLLDELDRLSKSVEVDDELDSDDADIDDCVLILLLELVLELLD